MAIIKFSQAAIQEMISEAESMYPDETGGILLGFWTAEFQEAIVVKAIGPGPCAKHSSSYFYPDGEYHRKVIEENFIATNGRVTYLGDWHSHPLGGGGLSRLDRLTLKKIAKTPESQTIHPLMIILAGKNSWEIYAWGYDPRPWQKRKKVRKFILHQAVS